MLQAPVRQRISISNAPRTGMIVGLFLAVAVALFLAPSVFNFLVYYLMGVILPWQVIAVIFLGLIVFFFNFKTLLDSNFLGVAGLFALLIFFFEITGLWSMSQVYWQQKAVLTAVLPILSLAAGYVLGVRPRAFELFCKFNCALGFVLLAFILIFGIEAASSYGEVLVGEERTAAGYQTLSRYIGICTVTAVILASSSKGSSRYFFYLVTLIFAVMLAYSGGRIGLLYFCVFLAAFSFCKAGSWMRFAIIAIAVLLTILAYSLDYNEFINAVAASENVPGSIARMFYYLSDRAQLSAAAEDLGSRQRLHELALQVWKTAPFFGVGWGSFPVDAGIGDEPGLYPHSIFFELLAETGVFGLAGALLFLAVVIARYFRATYPLEQRASVIGLFFGGLAIALNISDFTLQRELVLSLGLMTAHVSVFAMHRRSEVDEQSYYQQQSRFMSRQM
jgi:O-antigen ligase